LANRFESDFKVALAEVEPTVSHKTKLEFDSTQISKGVPETWCIVTSADSFTTMAALENMFDRNFEKDYPVASAAINSRRNLLLRGCQIFLPQTSPQFGGRLHANA
jgi:hypothetical protein